MKKIVLLSKYTAIGGMSALMDICLLYVFVDLIGFYYLSSAIISFVVATLFGFIFQKKVTFKDKNKRISKQLSYFFAIAIFGMGLYIGIIYIFVSVLSFWYIIAACISKIICFIWNFLMNYFVTFKVEKA